MQFLNIIVAMIVALGFWKVSNKEEERKTSHANITKCAIYLVLTICVIIFYYKSYQVTTIRNIITIEGFKGSYRSATQNYVFNKDTTEIDYIYPYDYIEELVVVNRFSSKDINWADPKDLYSGFYASMYLDNTSDHPTKKYRDFDEENYPIQNKDIKHLYEVSLFSNTTPSLLPFSIAERAFTDTSSGAIKREATTISGNNINIGHDFDRQLTMDFFSLKNDHSTPFIYRFSRIQSKTINNLNFITAADLSQFTLEVSISSDLPIEKLSYYFDVPIEMCYSDTSLINITSKSFDIKSSDHTGRRINDLKIYHVKLPTLSNLQLIRSLILTSLLTALIAVTCSNFYYLFRQLFKQLKRKKRISFSTKRRIVLLWIPVGKIIIWSFIILFTFLLIRITRNNYFVMELWRIKLASILFIIGCILYIYLIIITMRHLYNKGKYLRDIKIKIKLWNRS